MNTHESNITAKAAAFLAAGILCGILCGGSCVLFVWATTFCDTAFHENSRLLFLLPAAGVIVVLLYDYYRKGDTLSMDAVFDYSHGDTDHISLWLAPFIFLSTCLAYLTGGSVGRVGAAMQIGGCLGAHFHEKFCLLSRLDGDRFRNLFLACGISAAFSAMLNTPVAGAVFGVEVLIMSGAELLAIIPSFISAFIAYGISGLLDTPYTDLHVNIDFDLTPDMLWKLLIIAFAATLASRVYCYSRRAVTKAFSFIENKIARVLAGTGLVIVITLLSGVTWYNGIGFSCVREILDGNGDIFSFLWKLALTTITLGCGFRGGDISPTIFVGATACFTIGCFIGLDPAVSAGMGIVGTLASATKCPVAVCIMGFEMLCFSADSALCFIMAAIIAHFFSGTCGLYAGQRCEKQLLKIRIP